MQICKRGMALLLALVLIFGTAMPIQANPAKNNGVRHEECTALSSQAQAYYTGPYTWDLLQTLEGTATESSLAAMESPLYDSLQTLMTVTMTHSVSYKSLTSYWPDTDTQPGYHDATLFYSDCDGSGNQYNREHVWPKSRASFYQSGGGSDLHHLRPTDAAVNSTRSNYTMGDVKAQYPNCSTKTYQGKTVLWYAPSADLVEVADNVKGDVARIMLYVYTRWGEPNLCENVSASNLPQNGSDKGGNNGLKVMEDLDTLLRWCQEDPVDQWEMTRNDRVEDVQGNRNVFIDYPELAWMLFDREIPAMQTPSGYAMEGSGPAYTISVTTNGFGTAEVQGKKILCHPAEGYYTAGATVQPENGAVLTRDGNTIFLRDVTQNVTVHVEFLEKTRATVEYFHPQNTEVQNPVLSCYLGDTIILPHVTGNVTAQGQECTFAGWVETEISDTTDRVKFHKAGENFTVQSEAVELYTLYTYSEADDQGSPNTFTRLNVTPDDFSGSYVMTGETASAEYVHLATGHGVGTAEAAVSMTQTGISKSGEVLSNVSPDYVLTLERLSNGNYSIQLQNGEYLFYKGTGNSLNTAASASDPSSQWTFQVNSGFVTVHSVGHPDRVLQFNPSAAMFRCYTGSQEPVILYRGSGATVTHYLTILENGTCQHHGVLQNAKDPTCTEPGYTGDLICEYCGEILEQGTTIPALGHKEELRNAKDPTCTEDGYTGDVYCTICGDLLKQGESIPATGHQEELRNATDPTCTEDGYTGDVYCTICGDLLKQGESIPATGHQEELRNATDPTCTEDGYTGDVYCTICGDLLKQGESIPATGHQEELRNAKDPTCTEDGYTGDVYCSVCGDLLKQGESIPATGHQEELRNAKDPTCTEEGYTGDVYCSVCGELLKQGESIPATGHQEETRNAKDPTCTEDGYTGDVYCTICGDLLKQGESIPATGHQEELRNAKEPTITRDGYTGDVYCSVCGELLRKGEILPAEFFGDVKEKDWFYEAVFYVADQDLMQGMPGNRFAPKDFMTRAQLVTVLYRLAGTPDVTPTQRFEDVKADAWYIDAISWAVEQGITQGMSSTAFAPNRPVSREQMVVFFARFTEHQGIPVEATGDLSGFTDADKVSEYAVEAMTWAVETGLITGMGHHQLLPQSTSNRAQIATILMRYHQKMN